MMISEEGRQALSEWAKIRDYIVPSVTLSFSEKEMKQALEIAFAEKIPHHLGIIVGRSIEVPADLVSVFSHLLPNVIDEAEKEVLRLGRGRRHLVTAEESKEKMARQIKEWQKKNNSGNE